MSLRFADFGHTGLFIRSETTAFPYAKYAFARSAQQKLPVIVEIRIRGGRD